MDYLYYYLSPTSSYAKLLSGETLWSFSIFGLVILVLSIIAMWKMFEKAGESGWKSIIPIYNMVVLYKIAGLSPWLLLLFLTGIIPIIGALIAGISGIVLFILLAIRLSKAFGHGGGYAIGLIFLNTIFILILGLGKSKYVGPNGESTTKN